jgi:hypothetical protein
MAYSEDSEENYRVQAKTKRVSRKIKPENCIPLHGSLCLGLFLAAYMVKLYE